MLRKIIKIDEALCDGCENCIPACAEGALQIIDGKARLISDLFCDGLGACVGNCPTGAMTIVEREAEPYDEKKVMDYIVKGGPNVIEAHLEHLREHEEYEYLALAKEYLQENNISIPENKTLAQEHNTRRHDGCPGSRTMSFGDNETSAEDGQRVSHLRQWPVQLHLISPQASYYRNSDLLLAADCCGFAYPDFHKDFLKGKSIAIACPKLDTNQELYLEKLTQMISLSNLNSITVMVMQVPCCSGLFQLAKQAAENSGKDIVIKVVVIGIHGEILQEVEV
jgi:Pyruvate/2-oxoacid:ferredoxin oxidoreductase delta subunit